MVLEQAHETFVKSDVLLQFCKKIKTDWKKHPQTDAIHIHIYIDFTANGDFFCWLWVDYLAFSWNELIIAFIVLLHS